MARPARRRQDPVATLPRLPDKHGEEGLVRPERFLAFLRETGRFPTVQVPEAVILCFQSSLLDHVREHHPGREGDGYLGHLLLPADAGGRVRVYGGFGVGAPIAAIRLEDLIAFGVRRVIALGTAGSLQPDLAVGDLVLCLGATWTTDAPYRETRSEVRHHGGQGVLTVEMEAAALFAVATYRGIDLAAAFSVSDALATPEWTPRFGSRPTRDGLGALYRAAVDALDDGSGAAPDDSSSGGRVR